LTFGKDLLGVLRKACFSLEKKRALSLARRYSASRPLTAGGTSIYSYFGGIINTGHFFRLEVNTGWSRSCFAVVERKHERRTLKGVWMSENKERHITDLLQLVNRTMYSLISPLTSEHRVKVADEWMCRTLLPRNLFCPTCSCRKEQVEVW
jgi:hypothetical protein